MMRRVRDGIRAAVCLAALLAAASCSRKAAVIEVTPKKAKLYGLERPLRLNAHLADRKGQAVSAGGINWSSSKPDVVEVDSTGRLLSKHEGSAVVTATFGNLSTQVPVQVIDVKEIRLTPLAARIVGPSGTRFPLAATIVNSRDAPVALPLTWSSSDEKVLTVSPDGEITTVGAGSAVVVARLAELQAAADVTVDPRAVSRVEVRPATALVRVGDSQHFEIAVFDRDGKPIEGAAARFVSSDPAVATVDAAGVAAGKRPGTATIRAEVGGATAEAVVLVN